MMIFAIIRAATIPYHRQLASAAVDFRRHAAITHSHYHYARFFHGLRQACATLMPPREAMPRHFATPSLLLPQRHERLPNITPLR